MFVPDVDIKGRVWWIWPGNRPQQVLLISASALLLSSSLGSYLWFILLAMYCRFASCVFFQTWLLWGYATCICGGPMCKCKYTIYVCACHSVCLWDQLSKLGWLDWIYWSLSVIAYKLYVLLLWWENYVEFWICFRSESVIQWSSMDEVWTAFPCGCQLFISGLHVF
jgi:hypothetical protein